MKDSTAKVNPVFSYFITAFDEFKKVTWPTKEQAALLTAIVIGVSLLMSIIIAALDLGLSQLYQMALTSLTK